MAHRIAVSKTIDGVSDFYGERSQSIMDEVFSRARQIKLACESAVCVVADNINEYYWSNDKTEWSTRTDFPCCVPFAPITLVEWRNGTEGVACILITHDRFNCIPEAEEEFAKVPDDHRWVVQSASFVTQRGGLFFSVPFVQFSINEHGNPSPLYIRGIHSGGDPQNQQRLTDGIHTRMHVPLLAMSFANCRNVARDVAGKECEPDKPWARKNNAPTIKYHILNINPMKEILRTEGGSETNGIKKALHLCRGHFRYVERPFGRDTPELQFVRQHIRGNAKNGAIVKDYAIGKVK
jgi:hypothetical protein